MTRIVTTDDLVSAVTSLLDERNTSALDETLDILPALNRAQDYITSLLARAYKEPFLAYDSVTLTAGTYEYDIPTDAIEQKLERVEIALSNGTYEEVPRISYRDVSSYETSSQKQVPDGYVVVGTRYRLVAPPNATFDARIWYLRCPEPLVPQQGRIVSVAGVASNYLDVDTVGDSLTTSTADLNCYVNLIDYNTGVVKGTLQLSSIDSTNGRLTFSASPTRASVRGHTIEGDLDALAGGVAVAADDYVCTIHGTCVPFMKQSITNLIVQHAVTELKVLKLGEEGTVLLALKKQFEDQVERTWVGREQSLRVRNNSPVWSHRRASTIRYE